MELCLYNTYSDNIAGACHYHHCKMTPRQIDTKKCRQKQCNHMEKLPHEYWNQIARKKQKRKDRKERLSAINH